MKLIVNPHKIEIDKSPVNEREINISKCEFVFSDEITSDYVKEAYFTFGGTTYKQIIVNDECDFPSEVLTKKGTVEIGVVAYLVENETEIKRYNPSPAYFNTWDGSLKDDYENSEPITPTDKEQIEQAITNLQNDVTDLEESKQDTLVSGENIKTINGESVLGSGNIEIDLSNYYNKQEIDQSQASQDANISKNADDIEALNNNLANYSLITETGSQIALNINSSNYQMTAILKDKNGNTIYTSNVIDLPIESMIIDIDYDSATKEIVFTLQSGTTLRVSVADLVSGLVSTDELNTILASYYTKTEIDTLLQAKANASDVYAKTDVYNKTETDTLLNAKQNTLTFDNTPTENSTNPVTSGGIYDSQEEQNINIELLQNLVNQMPTVEATGTDISLQDVLNYRFMKFVMKGNSSQFSTTGKNLFDKNNPNILNKAGLGGSQNKIYSTSSNCKILYINCEGDTTYTVSKLSSSRFTVATCEETPQIGASLLSISTDHNATSITVTTPSDAHYLLVWYYREDLETVTEQQILDSIQIEEGSTATSYEPYTGGVPAPSPSYPYPVKTVTGENSLIISNVNLFDDKKRNYYFNNQKQFVNIASASTTGYIPAKEGDTFTIYTKASSTGIVIASFDAEYNCLKRDAIGTTSQSLTHTCPANTRYIVGSNYIGVSTDTTLVKGNTPLTNYIDHQSQTYPLSFGNMEFCSSPDGTIRDYIYGTPNNWYKKQFIGKVVLDGSESGWTLRGTDTNTYRFTNDTVISNALAKDKYSLYYCNEFKIYAGNSGIANIDDNGIALRDSLNGFTIRILKTLVTGLDNFKTWLSSNNVTGYYLLATPVDVQITDSTLINQLNNIYNNAHSFNGVTNITSTYASGNEQMIIEASALSDIFKQIQSNTNAILELGGD